MVSNRTKCEMRLNINRFVLSPTHLHEFKTADGVYTQAPVMSLYLPDQKLGSHSQPDSSSNKFMLKGRQTGGMHRGHSWVFRAETYDTMLAWYDAIKNLTEKTGEERNHYVRGHSRSFSSRSAASTSSFEDDEADQVPYSTEAATALQRTTSSSSSRFGGGIAADQQTRPQPGGRFPSDVQMNNRDLPTRLSGSSNSSEVGHDLSTAAGGLNVANGKDTMQSTPMDQKSLKDLEGALFITQNRNLPPSREHIPDRGYAMPSNEPTKLQQSFQPTTTDPYRSSAGHGHKVEAAMPGSAIAAAPVAVQRRSAVEDDIETPLLEKPATFASNQEDGFRVHQSPERPVKTSTQDADSYVHYSAPIESYMPPATQTQPVASENTFTSAFSKEPENAPISKTTGASTALDDAPVNPGISRKNTDASISNFHVPGEYPRTPRTSIV
jgi:hypothetical protein